MATAAAQSPERPRQETRFWPSSLEFLRWELLPYPGRISTAIRMVVGATLVMIIVMTFQIPSGVLAGFYSLLVARENLAATFRQAVTIIVVAIAATALTLAGMMLFRDYPIAYFFWVVATLGLGFFLIRTSTNYGAAVAFGFVFALNPPIWDQDLGTKAQVAATLWQAGAIAIGVGVTVVTEAVYRLFDRSDPLISSIADLMLAAQRVIDDVAERRTIPEADRKTILQYDLTGAGRLRASLARQGVDSILRAQRTAMIALTGHLIELAAELVRTAPLPTDEDVSRLRRVSEKIGRLRRRLCQDTMNDIPPAVLVRHPSATVPVLGGIERTVELLIDLFHRFHRAQSADGSSRELGLPSQHRLIVPDAFSNPEYLRFAFAGCAAASLCYVLYHGIDWPGLSTSVFTCVATGASTIGPSVQMQFFRLAGFVVGCLIIGIPAQILILPHLDTIFGFALFFAAGTAIAAWFATSSPRISYFGLQVALAFFFINLQEFHVQTDLSVARDRVVGVLLGVLAMGFIFDRFGLKSDTGQMRKELEQNLRMLARFGVLSTGLERAEDIPEIRRLRNQINGSLTSLASRMDTIQFEIAYGRHHEPDFAEHRRILRAQAALRSIYALDLSLLHYRARSEIESALTRQQRAELNHFLDQYSDSLLRIVAWSENEAQAYTPADDNSIRRLRQIFEQGASPSSQTILDVCEQLIISLHSLEHTYAVS
jgi:multidrug resistance protein MdtO